MGATKQHGGRPHGTVGQPNGLTARQEAIVRAIQTSIRDRGYPPSMRQLGEASGLASTSSVSYQIGSLVEKGLLRKDPKTPRAYTLTARATKFLATTDWAHPDPPEHGGEDGPDGEDEVVSAPLVGRISAGVPITAEQRVEGRITLSKHLVGSGDVFALTVRGDSMIGAHIVEGDTVIVRSQPEAESGAIVAAMIDGEATIKRFKRKGSDVWLVAENPSYAAIDARQATILGRVVSVQRRL
ncbi:transcriptional repressor LexA [Streptomyces sp. NBC_00470]|uniref:transcriptional repressor LexA n=1 Tax=Streptomyces sp. NBC_00470 TaxID=2975753 RepID=UPI002F90728D